MNFEFVDMTKNAAIDSSVYRFNNRHKKYSYDDCIGYITANKANMKFLAGGKEVRGMRDVEDTK